jgi:hypothetical protein
MESILIEEEVLSRQTGITAQKGHNCWFDYWIALNVWQYFLEDVFFVVIMESLLIEEEVLSR